MAGVEDEAVGDGGSAGDERQQGEEHVGIVDAPSAVARRMLLAREENSVGAAGEDEGGTDDRRGNVERDIWGKRGDHDGGDQPPKHFVDDGTVSSSLGQVMADQYNAVAASKSKSKSKSIRVGQRQG